MQLIEEARMMARFILIEMMIKVMIYEHYCAENYDGDDWTGDDYNDSNAENYEKD